MTDYKSYKHGFSEVNGLKMYFEFYGNRRQLYKAALLNIAINKNFLILLEEKP